MLRLRKSKLVPQQVSDLGAFIFVCAMIPITYLWEVAVVSPAIFPEEVSSSINDFVDRSIIINSTKFYLRLR